MFATIRQKWNAFKLDWKEYQRLRRVAARAWHKFESVRGKITVLYNMGDVEKVKSCISRKFVPVPTVNFNQDELNPVRSELLPYDSYCSHFKGNVDGENTVACSQTNCPCYAGHCEYVAAAKELEIARAKRDAFWNDKSKTKSK